MIAILSHIAPDENDHLAASWLSNRGEQFRRDLSVPLDSQVYSIELRHPGPYSLPDIVIRVHDLDMA